MNQRRIFQTRNRIEVEKTQDRRRKEVVNWLFGNFLVGDTYFYPVSRLKNSPLVHASYWVGVRFPARTRDRHETKLSVEKRSNKLE